MNRIAIVGHPSSGYQDVEALLKQYGMADAAPSRREGVTIHQVQEALGKAYKVPPLEHAQHEEQLAQLEPGPVWRELALDLLLGNQDQQGLWGWAAPNTLPLLQLWHDVDEQTRFVLAYQHPTSALEQALAKQNLADPDNILNNWAAYHGALLAFYLRHPERCLLVHSQQLMQQPDDLLNQLPGLEYPSEQTMVPSEDEGSAIGQALELPATGKPVPCEEITAAPLAAYVSQQVVAPHDALSIYDALQASATLAAAQSESISTLTAWQSLHAQQAALSRYGEKCRQAWHDAKNEVERSRAELGQLSSSNAELQADSNKLKEDIARLKQENAELKLQLDKPVSTDLEEENTLLLEQLYLVQEELERLHQNGSKATQAGAKGAGPYYGADERIKRQLTYRLGSVVVRSNSVTDYLKLPFALRREHKAFQKDKQSRQNETLPPIERYVDAHKAQQVKRHLSYRLGRIIMVNASSPVGWLKLPFALASEAKRFRQERDR